MRFMGLSPRGRGKPRPVVHPAPTARSIPAWAGETLRALIFKTATEVYPRVGGGNTQNALNRSARNGLSPRGRGKRICEGIDIPECGSIPAWAGETSGAGAAAVLAKVYPRVGGGNEGVGFFAVPPAGLSPRGRGKRLEVYEVAQLIGSIPAWAGETPALPRRRFG